MGLILTGSGTVNLAASNTFTGDVAIQSGTLELTAAGAAGSGAISFAGATAAALDFTAANAPTNTIGSFGQGNAIHIDNFFFTGDSYSGQALSLSGSGSNVSLTIPGYTLADFQVSNDATGTEILSEVPCYLRGTRLATPNGETLVEALQVGDTVTTHDGKTQTIKWIGHRRIDCARHPQPRTVWPIRIQAGAFRRQAPRQDLFLSPDHAVFADGILIPIKHLINGRTITQETRAGVTYYHVELDQHDVLLAEGLPCESYLDNGTRTAFANGGSITQLHPDFSHAAHCEAIGEAASYAPLRIQGDAVDRIAARLQMRASSLGHATTAATPRKRQRLARSATTDLATLLDPDFYRAHNPDVAAAAIDPTAHYARHGRQEGRDPCSGSDLLRGLGLLEPATIIRTMADVVAAGIDPVEHFCAHGWQERRNPNPYFDTAWYLDTHRPPAGVNPLVHYVLIGEAAGLAPSPHFDPVWYRQHYRLAPAISALAHHLLHRRSGRVSPLPSFDVAAYVQANAAILRPNRDPYAHYRAIGRFMRSAAAA
jgi:autotransporter-associated beta strand protein